MSISCGSKSEKKEPVSEIDMMVTYSELGLPESGLLDNASWFSENDLIGNQTKDKILLELEGVETKEFIASVKKLTSDETLKNTDIIKDVWKHTSHAFGFIPKTNSPSTDSEIINATTISPQKNLKKSKIKITLDRLVTMDYPGKGEHSVLFDFYAKNQIQSQDEHVHFNQVYRIREGEQAGISGYPVFSNLSVGEQGVDFKCFTVNVENKNDKKLIGFLEGDLFKSGLTLLNNINPVTPMLSGFAKGFTDQIKNRNKNVPVQDIYLGLDTEAGITTRAKLAEGSYVVIQVPDVNKWDWSDWKFKASIGQMVLKEDETKGPPFNYFIFSISKM
tara:strand:+ start:326 stop:1324 length:999 start_codon:yes stop_codon:yes gene_type:complete